MFRRVQIVFVATLVVAAVSELSSSGWADTAGEIYARRVLPLIESDSKSSCTECHLRGVELRDFLSADPAETFAELRARGWVDVKSPEKSKLLEFIAKESDQGDPLLSKVRQAEHEALRAWLVAAVAEPELLKAPIPKKHDLDLPVDFIRHARQDRVLASFADTVWSQLARCSGCHSPDRNAKQVEKHGEQMSWIVPGKPAETLKLLVERDLIDLEKPEESLLRTKPLVLVEHGGGPKFPLGSSTDTRWKAFLIDYAQTVRNDGYKLDAELPVLPERRSWLSELQVRITELPDQWRERLMVVTLHRNTEDHTIDEVPVARGESRVHPEKNVWQNALVIYVKAPRPTLDAGNWSKPIVLADAIPRGNYTLRVHLVVPDEEPALQLVGTYALEAPWKPGYQPPKELSWTDHRKP